MYISLSQQQRSNVRYMFKLTYLSNVEVAYLCVVNECTFILWTTGYFWNSRSRRIVFSNPSLLLVVDRVLSPVLAQGSTAMGSLTSRVKPERLVRHQMGMTTGTTNANNGLSMRSMYDEYTSSILHTILCEWYVNQ